MNWESASNPPASDGKYPFRFADTGKTEEMTFFSGKWHWPHWPFPYLPKDGDEWEQQ